MDQQKIGAFMAACRKRKKLTQRQLAEALGVTDRSVSNWENGVCLPDASLYHFLCELLQISIEEFFAGDFLPEGQEQNAADSHLLHLLERQSYDASSKEISFDEFQHSLKSFSEAALLLRRFETEQAAVDDYLVSETGSPAEECASAYEIYRKMFD